MATYGKSGPPVPPRSNSIGAGSAAVVASNRAMASDSAQGVSQNHLDGNVAPAVPTQADMLSGVTGNSRHEMRGSMREREDRKRPSNTSGSGFWISAGRYFAGNSSHPPQRVDPLVAKLQQLPREDLIYDYLKQLDRADAAEDRIARTKAELEATYAKNSSLNDQIAGQDSVVRKAQESVFAAMASSGPKAEDDDVVRARIKSVMSEWKPFARKWAWKSIDDIPEKSDDEAHAMFNALWAADEYDAPDGLFAPKNATKAPYVLLNAQLADFIRSSIIRAPFIAAFGLGTEFEDGTNDSFATAKSLGNIYNFALKGDRAAAHLWRSHTVAALDPPSHGISADNFARKEEASRRKEKFYRCLVTQFETSSARLLLRNCSEEEIVERRTKLLEIFHASGELFSTLWSQKIVVDVLGRSEFVKKSFKNGSIQYEPHASHRLDEGDNSMDGMPIQLVVEPAIIAWGNERGGNYDRYKIWTKAVVWLSSGSSRPSLSRKRSG